MHGILSSWNKQDGVARELLQLISNSDQQSGP